MIYQRMKDRFQRRSRGKERSGASDCSSTQSTNAKEKRQPTKCSIRTSPADPPQQEADRMYQALQKQSSHKRKGNNNKVHPLPVTKSVLESLQKGDPESLEKHLKQNPKANSALRKLESTTREDIRGSRDAGCESGVPKSQLPKHIAIIMDGNRRYGQATYQNPTAGHVAGSRKLLELVKWCVVEHIQVLTVYAFSTENWKREQEEVSALMNLFRRYCAELQKEAKAMNIRVNVLSTDTAKLPLDVQQTLQELEQETKDGTGMIMNVCMSYGGRSEIVGACQQLAQDAKNGTLDPEDINEEMFGNHLLTGTNAGDFGDPDLLIRTSGEVRLSNFLLWQLAYTEMFFLEKHWPEVVKEDFLEILRVYANKRQRRYGK